MEETFKEQDVLRRVRRELYLTDGLSAMDDESLRTLIRKILLRQNPDHDFSAKISQVYFPHLCFLELLFALCLNYQNH